MGRKKAPFYNENGVLCTSKAAKLYYKAQDNLEKMILRLLSNGMNLLEAEYMLYHALGGAAQHAANRIGNDDFRKRHQRSVSRATTSNTR